MSGNKVLSHLIDYPPNPLPVQEGGIKTEFLRDTLIRHRRTGREPIRLRRTAPSWLVAAEAMD